jgi:MoaA/NifB/PqqE/SkfB family radical SAM enzyme
MCDIWKIKYFPEIPVDEFLKLPSSLRDINLSGGEPFLRLDLPEIVKVVKQTCPQARIVISSNGFATELIIRQMKKILKIKPDIGVAISIDGLGEKHNEMRGIPGGFDKAINTVKELQKLGMKNLRLGFTVTERNVLEMSKVYDLTRELGIQFTHSFAQSSDFYFGGKQNNDFSLLTPSSPLAVEEDMPSPCEGEGGVRSVHNKLFFALRNQYKHIISSELKSWNIKKWLRAYFSQAMFNFITSKNPELSSAPGRDFFFMDPSGDIYPSVVHNIKMGNIIKVQSQKSKVKSQNNGKTFEQFWCSKEVEEVRKKVDDSKVPVWMICTARTAIKKHPFRVGWWIARNKIFNFQF